MGVSGLGRQTGSYQYSRIAKELMLLWYKEVDLHYHSFCNLSRVSQWVAMSRIACDNLNAHVVPQHMLGEVQLENRPFFSSKTGQQLCSLHFTRIL